LLCLALVQITVQELAYRGSRIQVKRQEGYREEFREDHGVGNRVRRPDEEKEKARRQEGQKTRR
jgi:hypothetical protein